MSDQGNKDNGSRDQIVCSPMYLDTPSLNNVVSRRFALGPKIRFGSREGTDAPNRFFMKGIGLSSLSLLLFFFFSVFMPQQFTASYLLVIYSSATSPLVVNFVLYLALMVLCIYFAGTFLGARPHH